MFDVVNTKNNNELERESKNSRFFMCGRANSHFLQEGGRLFPNRHQGAPPPSPSIPQHCQTLLQCLFLTRLARVAGLIEPLRWACSSTLGSFLQNMSSSPYSGIFISLRIKFHTNHTCLLLHNNIQTILHAVVVYVACLLLSICFGQLKYAKKY